MRKVIGPRGHPTELTTGEQDVILRVPLGTAKELLGWLCIEYHKLDPLVATLSVRAPSRAVALERTILRQDLRTVERTPVHYSALNIQPAVRGLTAVVFDEKHVTVNMLIPTESIERFVRATDDLVPPGRGETSALSEAFIAMVDASGHRRV
jgi:hypothetical protein